MTPHGMCPRKKDISNNNNTDWESNDTLIFINYFFVSFCRTAELIYQGGFPNKKVLRRI